MNSIISRVVNVVATADLGQRIDLSRVGLVVGGVYNPTSYPCAYLKLPEMRGRVTVFSSGKLISAGTKTPGEARSDLAFVARILESADLARRVSPKARVRNVVTTFDLGGVLDLTGLHGELEESVYEPEIFPGLMWKPGDFPAHFLLFGSGKVVASVKSMRSATRARKYLQSRIRGRGWPGPLGGRGSH